jgi:hypothetical protein
VWSPCLCPTEYIIIFFSKTGTIHTNIFTNEWFIPQTRLNLVCGISFVCENNHPIKWIYLFTNRGIDPTVNSPNTNCKQCLLYTYTKHCKELDSHAAIAFLISRGCQALPPSDMLCLPYMTGSAEKPLSCTVTLGRDKADNPADPAYLLFWLQHLSLKCLLSVYNSSTSLIKTQQAECELLD